MLSCNNLTGSIADLAIIGIDVWPSDRIDTIDLESLFQGTFCCDVDMHGRKHCTSCDLQTNRLNVNSFVKTPIVLIVATNRCHNELRGQLTRTCLDISQVLDIGIYIAGNHENVTPISNYVLSGTIQHIGSSRKSGHYVTYIFQILVSLLL